MTGHAQEPGSTTLPGTAAGPAPLVRVWDPFVRAFHWSLVLLFAVDYLTAEELETTHEVVGYAIIALVLLRIVWGFIGSEHARFRDFVFGPRTILAYLKDDLAGRAKRYLGHNPLGGAMVLLLLAGLLATTGTGWLMAWGGETHLLEDVHEVAANLTLLLIVGHVGGVIWSSVMHGENLVRAMVTGRKRAG